MFRRLSPVLVALSATLLIANPLPHFDFFLGNGEETYRIPGALGEAFGYSLAAGHVHIPFLYEDLVVGAPDASGGRGAVYVYHGETVFGPDSTEATILGDGQFPDGRLGRSVAVGDVNGDTIGDLVLGCPGTAGGGRVYVLFGGSFRRETDLGVIPASVTIIGAGAGDRLGEWVGVGDVDGDGIGDLILSAPGADPGGRTDAGVIYVIRGRSGLPAEIRLDTDPADEVMLGAEPYDSAGASVAVGDLDSDLRPDLVVGVPSGDPEGRTDAGKVHLLYGRATMKDTLDLRVDSDAVFAGGSAGDRAGTAVRIADHRSDGQDDLFIGAPGYGVDGVGAIFVYYGSGDRYPSKIDIGRAEYDEGLTSSRAGDRIGSVVEIARDVLWSGSPYFEIVIGSPRASRDEGPESGLTFLFPLSWTAGQGNLIDIESSYSVLIHGGGDGDRTGWALAAGDFFDNSHQDLAIGAPDVASGSGEVYLFHAFEFTGIGDEAGGAPSVPSGRLLAQNRPNPFNPSTTIEYRVPEGGTDGRVMTTLEVFTVRGRRIRTLASGAMEPGPHLAYWDGMDEGKRPVASGVYVYRIRAGERVETRKMVLAR